MNKDRVINIKEYIKYVVSHWYVLVLFVLGFTILFSVYYVNKVNLSNSETDLLLLSDDVYSKLSDLEKGFVNVSVSNYHDYCEAVDILNNSIISQINPYEASQVCLIYYLSGIGDSGSLSEDSLSKVNMASINLFYYCNGGGLAHDVSDRVGVDSRFLADCIVPNNYVIDSGCFSLNVYGSEIIPELPDIIKACIDEYIQSMEISDISIGLGSETNAIVRSSYVFSLQKSTSDGLKVIKNRIDVSIQNLSDQGRYSFELIARDYNPDVYDFLYDGELLSNNSFSTVDLLKHVALGVGTGVLLCLLLILCRFMFSPRIVTSDDYTGSVGIDILGNVTPDLSNIDFVISRINNLCKKDSIETIALVSSALDEYRECIEEMQAVFLRKGIEVSIIDHFIDDFSSYEQLLKFGCCIMVEAKNRSTLKAVRDNVAFCFENRVRVIGVVNIET